MKMFTNDIPHIVWARVRNGSLVVWTGKEEISFRHAYGRIRGVAYKMDEYNGQLYEICLLHLVHEGDRWILSLRTDSQYFRSMCNYLYTAAGLGVLGEPLRFAPSFTEKNGKKYSAIYVSHGEKYLKAHFNATNMGALPQPVTALIGGRTVYDFSPLTNFYKEFLAQHFTQGWGEPIEPLAAAGVNIPAPEEDPDDLPF